MTTHRLMNFRSEGGGKKDDVEGAEEGTSTPRLDCIENTAPLVPQESAVVLTTFWVPPSFVLYCSLSNLPPSYPSKTTSPLCLVITDLYLDHTSGPKQWLRLV